MGNESLIKQFGGKAKDQLNNLKASFTGEQKKSVPGEDGEMDALEIALHNMQARSQSFISLMDDSIRIQNFTKNVMYSDWKDRFPYKFTIIKTNPQSKSGYFGVATFRLLINPQDVTINTPFAIKTTVTSGGILEEHNGTPLKMITINGTTGLNIVRPSSDISKSKQGVMGDLFGGTISAAKSFVSSLRSSKNEFMSAFNKTGSKTVNEVTSVQMNSKATGYYQYHMLRIFLETYAKIKASPNGNAYRLVFEMHKDKQFYLVTPNNFTTKKSVSSPLEYQYTIAMTAWGSIPMNRSKPQKSLGDVGNIKRDLGTTRKLFNALKNLRKVTSKAKNVISNARADVESNIFGPINDTILLTKDVLSLPRTLADLPKSLKDSFQTSVISNWESLSRTNEDLKALMDTKISQIIEGGSDSTSAQPYLKSSTPGQQDYYESEAFDNIDLTDNIDLDSLTPTVAQQQAIDQIAEKALRITENDMRSLADELQALSDALEPEISSRPATDDEWDILYATQESIGAIYNFIADGSLRVSKASSDEGAANASRAITAIDFWEQNTSANNIPFNKYAGKFSVPFPFKSSLEELARIYLGDATLWPDIAAINGLQAPYVDEEGFTYNLIANGSGNSINVSSNKNLYAGQTIYISSDTEIMTKRKIQAINEITTTNYQIIVNGNADMNKYSSSDNAKIKAYLPYTVNSMRQIFIPTNDTPTTEDIATKPISFIDEDIEFIKFSKIDLLLDSDFDLAVTSDGFANLAYGKANLLQSAKLKLATIAGSKMLDPNYGAGVEVGESVADLNIDAIVENINTSFEGDDYGRYDAPSDIDFDISGNSIVMKISVAVRELDGVMNITIPLIQE